MAFDFQNIIAWQLAHKFVLKVYSVTKHFPAYEKYNLVSQFQRAAVSISANIAEGYKKLGKNDKLRFLNISQASLSECANYILLTHDLGYISDEEFLHLSEEVEETERVLNSYCRGIINNSGIKDD